MLSILQRRREPNICDPFTSYGVHCNYLRRLSKSMSIPIGPDMRRSMVANGEDLRDSYAEQPPSVQRTEREKYTK